MKLCMPILSVTISSVFRKPEKTWRDDGAGKLKKAINKGFKLRNIMKKAFNKEIYYI